MKSGGRESTSQGGPTCSSSQTTPGQTSAQVRVNELYVPMSFMKENFADATFPIHISLQVHIKTQSTTSSSRESLHSGIIRKYEHYGNRTFHYLLTSIQPTLKTPGSTKPKPVEWTKAEDGTVHVWLEMPAETGMGGVTSTATSDISLGTTAGPSSFGVGTSGMAVSAALSPTGALMGSGAHLLPGLHVSLGMPSTSGEQGVMGGGQELGAGLVGSMPGMLTSSMFGMHTSLGRSALDSAEMEDSAPQIMRQQPTSMDQLLEMIHPIGGAAALSLTGAPSLHTVHSAGASAQAMARLSPADEGQQMQTATSMEQGMMQMPVTSLPLVPLLAEVFGAAGMPAVMSAEQLQQQILDLVKKYRALQAELASTRNNLLTAESNLNHVQQELQKCRQELEATRTQHAQQQTLRRQLASTTASSAHNFMNTLTQLLALQ